jgi:flagellar motor switch protein FliM
MNDKVLTDEEKDALLDGVATGQVEVLSSLGPQYAEVQPFEIPARSRLKSNSFPRLQRMNQNFAGRLEKQAEQLVSAETTVTATELACSSYGEFLERNNGTALMVEFAIKELGGSGLIVLGNELVAQLVEAFYGGIGNESSPLSVDYFTRGEISVATRFGKDIASTLADIWRPVIDAEHTLVTTHQNSDLIEGFDVSDRVIHAEFEIRFLSHKQAFHIVWPLAKLGPLLPVFEGQKRERDAAQDASWERSLRVRLTDSVVGIASRVGKARMSLGKVAALQAGDVIEINNPRLCTLFVKHVPLVNGRFGLHEGKYAIEATDWLGPEIERHA